MWRQGGVAPLRRCRLHPLKDRALALHRYGQLLLPRVEKQQRSLRLRGCRKAVAQQRRLRARNVNRREAVELSNTVCYRLKGCR